MRELDVIDTFRFIEPGPVLLVTTQGSNGPNVMTMGFHMMMRHDAPLIGCIIGPWDHTYEVLRETGECVLSIPGAEMARTVVDIGNCSGADIDKFAEFDLETQPSRSVGAPILNACIANIECRLVDGTLADGYNLQVLEAIRLWAVPNWKKRKTLHHVGDGCFREDGRFVDHADRMTKWRHFAL